MRQHFVRSALIVALLSIIGTTMLARPASAAPTAQAKPGTLDTSFGGFGFAGIPGVVTPPGLRGINDIAVQPDGKTVVVGSTATANQLAVYRYLPDGRPDTGFDGDGQAIFSDKFGAKAVALQNNGRIVVGGTRDNDFQLARLTPAGALDPTFDGDGWAEDFDPQLNDLRAILVQADGKIVACGAARVGGDDDFGVTRYTTSGARDTAFSGDGKATIPFGGDDTCYDLALQNDGKLALAGARLQSFEVDFVIARLKTDGTLDSSFDGDGKLSTGFGSEARAFAVALQPDGKIVVLGAFLNTSYVARYLPSGALDGSFGSGGKRTIPIDRLSKLALQPDGKLLALGYHQSPDGDRKFAVHRMLTDGAPDATFNGAGIAWLDFGGLDEGQALAVLPDGRILAAGGTGGTGVLARLWPDGTMDEGGKQTHASFPGFVQFTYAMVAQPDGKLLVAGDLRKPGDTFSDAVVTRFRIDGQVDTTFGTLGSTLPPIVSTTLRRRGAQAIAIQPDGKIVTAGYTTWDSPDFTSFLVVRWNSNGAHDPTFNTVGFNVVTFSRAGGSDRAYALALAPDGKIVVAGNVWNGSRQVWGVARLTSSGALDPTFGPNQDGKVYVEFNEPNLNISNSANALAVQPDRRIVIGGSYNGNFVVQRLLENGDRDPAFGLTSSGYNTTDLGGVDDIRALALAPNGWLYAAGSTSKGGGDVALAIYRPDGRLAECQSDQPCDHWPTGTRLVDLGGYDAAAALALRGDGQLVAAGCSDNRMAAAQVSTSDTTADPLLFRPDFAGDLSCAYGVQFSGDDKSRIILAGQAYSARTVIGLAAFHTTPGTTRLDQTIAFTAPPDGLTTDPPFELSARASSGLPVGFTSSTPKICGVSGTTLRLTGEPGVCAITAEQAGDATYNPAPEVTSSFAVRDPARQEQTITVESDPLPAQPAQE